MIKKQKPNCYKCIYRGTVPGDCHSSCGNVDAVVEGDSYGKRSGWFVWPYNFDPVWLLQCSGFKEIK